MLAVKYVVEIVLAVTIVAKIMLAVKYELIACCFVFRNRIEMFVERFRVDVKLTFSANNFEIHPRICFEFWK